MDGVYQTLNFYIHILITKLKLLEKKQNLNLKFYIVKYFKCKQIVPFIYVVYYHLFLKHYISKL